MFYFECRICGYDSDEAKCLSNSDKDYPCPLCASDCLHENPLSFREATPEEVTKLGRPMIRTIVVR